MTQTVMVLMGGWSRERDVSLVSGKAVCEALKNKGYNVISYDPPHDEDAILKNITTTKPDVIFNALHGVGGEDGTIQTILDKTHIPYTHSNATSSKLAMDKKATKNTVNNIGVPVAKDITLNGHDFKNGGHPIPCPYVVKPVADGSSVGVYIVQNDDDYNYAVNSINNDDLIMAEQYIHGRELTVTVLHFDEEPKALCVTELKPKSGWYDYKAKYTDGMTDHILQPTLPDDITQQLLDHAVNAHTALGCAMLSRSDFRYNDDDGIIFLETNTQPGLTPLSLAPEQAEHCGIPFDDLIEQCILYALQKVEGLKAHG